MSKRYPAPWVLVEEPYRHIRCSEGAVWADDYKPDEVAALICAAPVMYEALKRIMEGGCPAFAEEQVRAVLSQAVPAPSKESE